MTGARGAGSAAHPAARAPSPAIPLNLLVFLTAGVSLAQWERAGILDRELALYRELIRRGHRVGLISYGGAEDREIARRLRPEFRVGHNGFGLPRHRYARLLPLLHARLLRWADVVKSNQTDGAEVALRAAAWHRRPMVARSGYHWSEFLAARRPVDPAELAYARGVESRVAAGARRWIVSTPANADALRGAHPGLADRLRLIPNYVDTSLFTPAPAARQCDVLWIGRLEHQKNPGLLVEALRRLPGTVSRWVGDGSLAPELRGQWSALTPVPEWRNAVPHAALPPLMNSSAVYVLCSRHEGHPKTLLEAMACGMAVIATDAPGIRENIRDGVTGVLCEPDPEALARALRDLLGDAGRRRELGRAARAHAEASWSLRHVATLEEAVLREAVDA